MEQCFCGRAGDGRWLGGRDLRSFSALGANLAIMLIAFTYVACPGGRGHRLLSNLLDGARTGAALARSAEAFTDTPPLLRMNRSRPPLGAPQKLRPHVGPRVEAGSTRGSGVNKSPCHRQLAASKNA